MIRNLFSDLTMSRRSNDQFDGTDDSDNDDDVNVFALPDDDDLSSEDEINRVGLIV